MAARRRWSEWFRRTSQELNGVAGLGGLGGIAIAGAGLAAGGAAIALTAIGAVIVFGTVGYAAIKGVPPALTRPEDIAGKSVKLKELQDVDPALPTWSIVGVTETGKTTLRSRLALEIPPPGRTQGVSAYVETLAPPLRYVAILDATGEIYHWQYELAEVCDHLCIIIDHNISHSQSSIDDNRLKDQKAFLQQIRYALDNTAGPKSLICFLINKRDLWQSASQDQVAKFEQFWQQEVDRFRQEKRANTIEAYPHSNNIPDDVARFMSILKRPPPTDSGSV